MAERISTGELADLLRRTADRHHAAFAATDGGDPEWALWYAGHLQAELWDRLGYLPTRGELVYLLVAAERAHHSSGEAGDWPDAYARFILEHAPG